MNSNILATAASKEELEKKINKYYFSSNYFINDSNEVENRAKNKVLDTVKIVIDGHRWKFERVDTNNQ